MLMIGEGPHITLAADPRRTRRRVRLPSKAAITQSTGSAIAPATSFAGGQMTLTSTSSTALFIAAPRGYTRSVGADPGELGLVARPLRARVGAEVVPRADGIADALLQQRQPLRQHLGLVREARDGRREVQQQ